MTKKIKHISELPKWFNLNNYKKANTIPAYSWHIQLIIRKYCMTCKDISDFNEPIEVIREKTFVNLGDHYFFRHWYDIISKINVDDFIISDKPKNPAISPLTSRTFFNIQKWLLPERANYEPEFNDYLIDAIKSRKPDTLYIDLSEAFTKCSNAPKQDWLREPIYKSLPPNFEAEGLIHVDLNYTDDQLVEHFKKWLFDIRTELDTEMKAKSFKQSDFNSWALYGVLPYLDLKIWERQNNVSIPNRVMADAIYLRGVGGEETVRKTTSTIADHILSEKSLNQLAGQVISQIQQIKAELKIEKNLPENF